MNLVYYLLACAKMKLTKCRQCGLPIYAERITRQFCSNKCRQAHYQGIKRGQRKAAARKARG